MIKKMFFGAALLALVVAMPVAAADSSDHEEARSLIKQKVECSNLTDDQLDKIGDYYMELMVPDQGHEAMDQMMGGEGSESLRQAHIFMARRWYCGDAAGLGMMGMMIGDYGPGMMNWDNDQTGTFDLSDRYNGMIGSAWGNNMMFGWGHGAGWMIFIYILSLVFLIVGIAAFIKYLLKK